MKFVRRLLLEGWGILLLGAIVGFLGPFGTFGMGDFLWRWWRWWLLMAGAWVTMRPIIEVARWTADRTGLPPSALIFWGMTLASFPLALLWRITSAEETRQLGGYAGLLSFTLLCAFAVMAVTWWAGRADSYLLTYYHKEPSLAPEPSLSFPSVHETLPATTEPGRLPRLHARLGPGFEGNVLALESEDHYVRVHGARQSVLLLLRLRDAIAEMDGRPGAQTHRSWWVARDAIAKISSKGPTQKLVLINGLQVPVARASVERLRQAGLLPACLPINCG